MRNNGELLYWFKDLSKDDVKIVCSLKVFLIKNDIKKEGINLSEKFARGTGTNNGFGNIYEI